MNTSGKKSISPLMWATSIAVIIFSGVGTAAFMGWLPTSSGTPHAEQQPVVAQATSHEAAPVHKKTHSHSARDKVAYEHPSGPGQARCANCGVIASIREINVPASTSGIGLVGGAVVGGLLGNQVGGGHGRDAATVVGAVGGAMAGNEIEKRRNTNTEYEITVRYDDGSTRRFHETSPPAWRPGDRVRVVDGAIRADG
ncbi:MAG: outer membrane lipoprotein [Gammaproteobacteria bacterium]